MAPRRTQYIELSGPIFEDDVARKFNGAVYAGMEEIADEGDDIMAAQIAAGGFVDTGRLLRSVDILTKRSSQDVTGYFAITPTDTWKGSVSVTKTGTKSVKDKKTGKKKKVGTYSVAISTNDSRPTKTWLARGTRSGKKLRPGYDFYSRTATALRNMNPNDIVAPYIAEALN